MQEETKLVFQIENPKPSPRYLFLVFYPFCLMPLVSTETDVNAIKKVKDKRNLNSPRNEAIYKHVFLCITFLSHLSNEQVLAHLENCNILTYFLS